MSLGEAPSGNGDFLPSDLEYFPFPFSACPEQVHIFELKALHDQWQHFKVVVPRHHTYVYTISVEGLKSVFKDRASFEVSVILIDDISGEQYNIVLSVDGMVDKIVPGVSGGGVVVSCM